MQFPRSCKEKRENRIVGSSCLRPHCTTGILISYCHPKLRLRCASPFWVQNAAPCCARHEKAAWYMVSMS